jgi:hypothetical protein
MYGYKKGDIILKEVHKNEMFAKELMKKIFGPKSKERS